MVLMDGKFGQAISSGCSMACIWGFKHDYMKDRRSGLYYKGETSCMIYPHTVRCAQHCRATIMGHPRNRQFTNRFSSSGVEISIELGPNYKPEMQCARQCCQRIHVIYSSAGASSACSVAR